MTNLSFKEAALLAVKKHEEQQRNAAANRVEQNKLNAEASAKDMAQKFKEAFGFTPEIAVLQRELYSEYFEAAVVVPGTDNEMVSLTDAGWYRLYKTHSGVFCLHTDIDPLKTLEDFGAAFFAEPKT